MGGVGWYVGVWEWSFGGGVLGIHGGRALSGTSWIERLWRVAWVLVFLRLFESGSSG